MKKILIITQNFKQGGLETNILTTIKYLKGLGHEFFLTTASDSNLEIIQDSIQGKLILEQEDFNNLTKAVVDKIRKYMKSNQIDLVMLHPYKSYILGSLACYLEKIPYFVFVHGPINLTVNNYRDYLFNKYFTFPNAKNIYGVSEELRKLLDENFHAKSKVLLNPIDLDQFSNEKKINGNNFVFVGRLDEDKIIGLKEVIKFVDFYNRRSEIVNRKKLIIVGDGNHKDELIEWILERYPNYLDWIELIGYQSKVEDFINGIVFGMGRVALESLFMGFPVVLVSYDGIKGLINTNKVEKMSFFNFSGRNSETISFEELLNQITEVKLLNETEEISIKLREAYDINTVGSVLAQDIEISSFEVEVEDDSNLEVYSSTETIYELLSFIQLNGQDNGIFDFIEYFKGKIKMTNLIENRQIVELENIISDKNKIINELRVSNKELTIANEEINISKQKFEKELIEHKRKVETYELEMNSLLEQERQHYNYVSTIESQRNDYQQQLNSIYNSKLWVVPKMYYKFRSKDMLLNKTINYTKLHGKKALLKKIKQKVFKVNEKSQKEKYISDFLSIIKKNPNKKIILFPTLVDWNIPLFQRPQHIALNMGNEGYLYFFCTNNIIDTVDGFDEVSKNCFVTNSNEYWLIEELGKLSNRDKILHLYSTDNIRDNEYIQLVRNNGFTILYEYVDEIHEEISGMKIQQRILDRHNSMLEDESVTVIATADKLYQEVKAVRKTNFALVTNGVQLGHFDQKFSNVPLEIKDIVKKGNPIIGYYGAFAKWLNYELIEELATKHPEWEILLIGKDYDGSINNSNISKFSNIHVVGPINYYQLPEYAQHFSISTIPFRINDITDSTSPIKLFEYMALNKPIVTTAMPECRKYKSVLIGENHDHFIEKIEDAVNSILPDTYYNDMKKEYIENTWDQKTKDIIKLL